MVLMTSVFSLAVPILVGYELTEYATSEDVGYVELCVVLFTPTTGLAPRIFELTVTTSEATASTYIPF